jgi:hypothetical protein
MCFRTISIHTTPFCRSQCPGGLRRRSTAARVLRLWVRIPPGTWMSVYCESCVLSGRGLCVELITRPEETYRLWCVVVCDLETSWMKMPWPTGGGGLSRQKQTKCLLALIMSNDETKFVIGISALLGRIRVLCSCNLGPKTGYPDRFVAFDALKWELLTASLHRLKTNILFPPPIFVGRRSTSTECARLHLELLTRTCYSFDDKNFGHSS